MQTSTSNSTGLSNSRWITIDSYPWLMLVSRSVLFLFFQLLIALVFAITGTRSAWDEAAGLWTIVVVLANVMSVYLLVRVFKAEGKNYFETIRFSRKTVKTDLLWFVTSTLIGLPIGAAPMNPLATWLFGDPAAPTIMMFRPLPPWVFMLSFLFPLTIAFAELPTYFGYSMPRLFRNGETQSHPWLAWLIASFFLAAQHMFLPLILDGRFMLWRLGMFLPFALFIGVVLKLRPTLLPYYMIVHALMDISVVMTFVMI